MEKVLGVIFDTMVHGNFVEMKALPFKKVILSIRKTMEPICRSSCENVAFSLISIFLRVHTGTCGTPWTKMSHSLRLRINGNGP